MIDDDTELEPHTLTVIPGRATQPETVEQPLQRDARVVVLAGPLFGQSFVVEADTIIGRSSEVVVSLRDQPGVSRQHARIVRKPGGTFEISDLDSRNGTWVNGQRVRTAPLHYGDRIQLGADCVVLFTYTDPAEEHLEHLRRMETVGRMTAGIAHDFNNLLMVLVTSLRQLEGLDIDRALPGHDADAAVADGLAAAEQAVALTERILSLSRPTDAEKRVIAVDTLIQDAAHLCRRVLPAGIRLAVSCEKNLQVWGYPVELQQVLMNLVINARDAMPDGGLLQLQARRARAATDIPGGTGRVVISVRDSGIGMDEPTRQRVFDPFFTTKDHTRGTGLGLATAFAVVQRHGGTFTVRSEPGEGATFRVYLPSADSTAQRERTDPPIATPGRGLPRTATRVMVLDDEPLVLRSTARQLKSLGYLPTTFGDPDDAVAALGSSEDFHAAIVDLHLDGTTALEVIPQIRRIRADLPILVFSGHWTEQQGDDLRQLGAAMLQKPCTRDGLRGILSRLTGTSDE